MNSIRQIEVIHCDLLVGRLALTKEGLCAFEYSAGWLNSGFSISPFELPLRSGVFIAKPRPFEGASVFLMTACLMGGACLFLIGICSRKASGCILCRCWIASHSSALQGAELWNSGRTEALFPIRNMRILRSWHWRRNGYSTVMIMQERGLLNFRTGEALPEVRVPKFSPVMRAGNGW